MEERPQNNYVFVMTLPRTSQSKVTNVVKNFVCKNPVRLCQMFGRYYWVPMKNEELANLPTVLHAISGVSTDAELQRCVEDKMAMQIGLFDNVPYRFFFIEDFSFSDSKLLMVVHHAFRDPISMFQSMQ